MKTAATHIGATAIAIPGHDQPFSLELPPALTALREEAISVQHGEQLTPVDRLYIDAESWAAHGGDEAWLAWRARRCAQRLRRMPLHVEPGERIVGKPLLRCPRDEEEDAIERCGQTLQTMPRFPGGDTGHFHPDLAKILRLGIRGIRDEIRSLQSRTGLTQEQKRFYAACSEALQGVADYICRTADLCRSMAAGDPGDAERWLRLEEMCRRLATEPPAAFHEALQTVFFWMIALWFGEDHPLTTPGRMDQTLRSFYEADLAAGRITPQSAFELICSLFIQANRILWPGSAISVMVGGRDAQGRDLTNELTYLCLAARQATRLVYPTVGVAWHPGTPRELMDFATRMLASGGGDPAFFNDEVISEGLHAHGVTPEDSHNYMNSTCVEIKVVGASNMWVTSPYVCCPAGLLQSMAADASGETSFDTFEGFLADVLGRLAATVRDGARHCDEIWKERTRHGGFPLASCVISDCLDRGTDYDRGGARYNWVENSFVGLANLVDGLIAVKHLVFGSRELSVAGFHDVLSRNFEGQEELRKRILNTLPKYGNDDPEADRLARTCARSLIRATESNTVGPHRYVPGFFCWIQHERLGSELGATPGGRLAGLPLADGAGAAQGREKRGPTASVLSTTSWPHSQVLGGLVHNAKFSRSMLRTSADLEALRNVIEVYMQRGGFEIQVNVVEAHDLRDAQRHPDQFPDLLVRVAGYSDYFVHLNRRMQNEVIARTEFSPA